MQQFAAREIGQRIAHARDRADGMTQEQLGDLLGLSKRQVQNIEAGVTVPWKHFRDLTAIFKRPMDWFLYGDEAGEETAVSSAQLVRLEDLLREAVGEIRGLRQDLRGSGGSRAAEG